MNPRIFSLGFVATVAASLVVLPTSLNAAEAPSIVIVPGSVQLQGPQARQTLIVERRSGELNQGQVRENLSYTVADPKVVQIDGDQVIPLANGKTNVSAAVISGEGAGQSATIEVTVVDFDKPFAWSFRNHVESVLTKTGCNSGACHGALAGKKGFKLSLRAYDPDRDYLTLTRQSLGRRIIPSDPGRSLILTKPTGAIPHGGGLRFDVDSREYRVVAEWIAAGAPRPSEDDARLQRIEILPAGVILKPGFIQNVIVLGHFSDGHIEDVTRWTKYTASDASVAEVDDLGKITVMGHGECAITGWYASQVAVASVTVPYETSVAPNVFASAPKRNLIDELVIEKLTQLNLPPSPPAADSEFLRRAFVDTIGVLPTADEARKFAADPSPDKRDILIESLLARPEFVDYWSYKWSDLLLVNSEKLPGPAMWSFHNWIRNQVAANTPWDRFAREIVTAKGGTLENGAANYYMLHEEPLDMSETTSVAFLGMSINCARCHNHPLEKWTNSQYYAMANLFARVRTKIAPGEGNRIVFAASDGDLIQPLSGKPQPPCPLDGTPAELNDPADRRVALADWLTSPSNPYFGRAIVNRVWANFMGVGLVEAVDDLRLTNPASNPKLHLALAADLAEHHFDLKSLMRLILQSATYQRSSEALPENMADRRFYSRYYPKRMMAEVMLDAFAQVTGAPTQFPNYPSNWRSLQLPDSNVSSYFLKTFGRPDRVISCECERAVEPSMVQVLHISNGDSINAKLSAAGNRIDQMLTAGAVNEPIVDELYWSAFSRAPNEQEKTELLGQLKELSDADRRPAIEDLYWSVLSSKEFLFNH